jgi:transposase
VRQRDTSRWREARRIELPRAPRPKPPGHGRNAAAAYTGASQVTVAHPHLHSGEACPRLRVGKLYPQSEPAKLLRITGMAPLRRRSTNCERLRCNLCGEVYHRPGPRGLGRRNTMRPRPAWWGCSNTVPACRSTASRSCKTAWASRLPAATQWDLVQAAAKTLAPAHEELINQAAQATVLYNDDTTMKVLQLTRKQRAAALADDADGERTGIFTSGIVATDTGHKIALFFTGVRHAGENLKRGARPPLADLPAPIQMCDGLSRNVPSDFDTMLLQCLAHARRKHVELTETFPAEVRFVLETLREVYITDARARNGASTPSSACNYTRTRARRAWRPSSSGCRRNLPNASSRTELHARRGDPLHAKTLVGTDPVPSRGKARPSTTTCVKEPLKKAILHRKTPFSIEPCWRPRR